MVRVTIGLPVFNGERYLREAIESVLAQTCGDFELVISDNASTDGTEAICREYAQRDPRIRYFRQKENVGAAKNFNGTVELARGEYFRWLAADSALEPRFVECAVKVLDEDPSVVSVCSKFIGISEFEKKRVVIDSDLNFCDPVVHRRFRDLLRRVVTVRGPLPIWGLMRSSVLKQTGLIRPFIGSDSVFITEICLKGKIAQVPDALSIIRRHPDSYSNIKDEQEGVEGVREARWFDPQSKGRFYLPHWRRLWEIFLLVMRSKEPFSGKCIMCASLVYPAALRWRRRMLKEVAFALGMKRLYLFVTHLWAWGTHQTKPGRS